MRHASDRSVKDVHLGIFLSHPPEFAWPRAEAYKRTLLSLRT